MIDRTSLSKIIIDNIPLNFGTELPLSEVMKRASTKRIIERYSYMLTDGCGSSNCDNENCVSSGKIKPLTPQEVTDLATTLLLCRAKLCDLHALNVPRTRSPSPFLSSESSNDIPDYYEIAGSASELKISTENSISEIVNICRNASKYSNLIRVLMGVFSKPDTLVSCFLKPKVVAKLNNLVPNDLTSLNEEKIRELEYETEINFIALRETYKSVFELPSHVFESCLVRALKSLADICEAELKMISKNKFSNPEEIEKYVFSFLIVFEMPPFKTSDYVNSALPVLCKTMSRLSYSAQAYICRMWARYCRHNFRNILEQLHQLIIRTIDCGGIRKCRLQYNDDIVSATKIMKILYYANALAGKVEVNTKDEDYDKFEISSEYYFIRPGLWYSMYQGSDISEDILASELKVSLSSHLSH